MLPSSHLLPFLADLEPDEAGLDMKIVSQRYGLDQKDIVMLNRNENPFGPSPRVWDAMRGVPLHLYPDSRDFTGAAADYLSSPPENILIGAGMDEIIITISRLFLGSGDAALIPVPTYNLYALATRMCGAHPIYRPLRPGLDGNLDIPSRAKMIFLCSPNNPTGETLSEEGIVSILQSTDGIVFLDEAYTEFAGESLASLAMEFENLVVGRTLSKAFGLAGMRLGYALAPSWISESYRKIAPLFSTGCLSLAAGVAALQDLDWMRQCVDRIVSERERMRQILPQSLPSQGNFLCLPTDERASLVAERLLQKGVAVRDCGIFLGPGEHLLRVSVGTPEQNDRFLKAFCDINLR